tara:strand:- start:4 stop:267 length:264 start_codon:yes stop_codon:yes gene_type:complete
MAKECKTGQYYDKKLKKCRDTYDKTQAKDKGMIKGYAAGATAGQLIGRGLKSDKGKLTALVGGALTGAIAGRYRASKKYGKKKKKKK